ncbi:MAG: type VI secretion system-associated FHA domain protein TagH [Rhodospirillales bacterium]|nr:type VI secretion system-associated FHA domain protein TagH [Rhodospirillales bacterium]
MALKLRVARCGHSTPAVPEERSLASGRLSIGRGGDNDWVLPDPEKTISKHHCRIEGAGASFRIFDDSVNGVFLNEDDQPLGAGNWSELHSGDRVRIGEWEWVVELSAVGEKGAALGPAARDRLYAEHEALSLGHDFTSVDALFGDAQSRPPMGDDAAQPRFQQVLPRSIFDKPAALRLRDLDSGAPLDSVFEAPRGHVHPGDDAAATNLPPPPVLDQPEPLPRPSTPSEAASAATPGPHPLGTSSEGGTFIPADLFDGVAPAPLVPMGTLPVRPIVEDETSVPANVDRIPPLPSTVTLPSPAPCEPTAAPIAETEAAMPSPPPSDAAMLAAFLAGAQLKPADVDLDDPAATMRRLGEIYRLVVTGVMEVLESRRALKNEFRTDRTEFCRSENNILKFSVDAESAMVDLLRPTRRGFLSSRQSFEEAFADIRRHEIGVLASMQEAWTDLLRRFDPKSLEQRLSGDAGLSGLLGSRKARAWDAFVVLYESIAGQTDSESRCTFERVFGEAYERHLARLKEGGASSDGGR